MLVEKNDEGRLPRTSFVPKQLDLPQSHGLCFLVGLTLLRQLARRVVHQGYRQLRLLQYEGRNKGHFLRTQNPSVECQDP
jgi:hypothetical protein